MKRLLFTGLLGAILATVPLTPGLRASTLTVTSTSDSGPGSLREAVAIAAAGDEIRFADALNGAAIQLYSGQIVIDKDLVLKGQGSTQTIIRGPGTYPLGDLPPNRIFEIEPEVSVTITGLSLSAGVIRGGDGPGGGAILNHGALNLTSSMITENMAWDLPGAGIYNSGGTLKLRDVQFLGNRIDSGKVSGGGGIFNDAAGVAELVGCVFTGQATVKASGGVIVNLGVMTIESSRFESNYGWGNGGAVDNAGILQIRDSLAIHNHTNSQGGAISNSGKLLLERTAIIGNNAEGNGGGILNTGEAFIINSTLYGNATHDSGAAIRNSRGVLTLDHVTIAGNAADNDDYYHAGGIQNDAAPQLPSDSGVVRVRNSLIIGNFSNACDITAERNTCIADCYGDFESGGHNIIGSLYGSDIYNDEEFLVCKGFSGLQGDLVSADATNVVEYTILQSHLPPIEVPILGENGGPTPTVALIPSSPARDAIPLSDCINSAGDPIAFDQRGTPRPQGDGCDVGAFEFSLPNDVLFWTQQCRESNSAEYEPEDLGQLLAAINEKSGAFPECAPATCEALEPDGPRSSWKAKAARELLAVWLNLASGRLIKDRPIDLSGLTSATTAAAAVAEIESTVCDPNATRQDLSHAKGIAEALNGSAGHN